jgi:hypothetical protein
VEYSLIARNKEILINNHTHERVTQIISAGLLEFASIIPTPYAASVGMSRDRFLALLTMLHLNNNDVKAARGQPGYDPFKILQIIDTLVTKF